MLTIKPATNNSPKLSNFVVFALIFAISAVLIVNLIGNDEPASFTIETITVPIECVNNGIGCPVNFDRSIIAPEPTPGGYNSGATDGSNTPGASTCDSKYCTFTRSVSNK